MYYASWTYADDDVWASIKRQRSTRDSFRFQIRFGCNGLFRPFSQVYIFLWSIFAFRIIWTTDKVSVSAFADNQPTMTSRTDTVGFHVLFYSYLPPHLVDMIAMTVFIGYKCAGQRFGHLQNLVVIELYAFMSVYHSSQLAQINYITVCRTAHGRTSSKDNNRNGFVSYDVEGVADCANMGWILSWWIIGNL